VSLQNIIETVTEAQKEAQYKEFKNILGDMLRSNHSFNRIFQNTKLILKSSIVKTEMDRTQSVIMGNCYNSRLCDVCHKRFVNSKTEILTCFGCGHQSHMACAYGSNNYDECIICRRNWVGNEFTDKVLINKVFYKNKNEEKSNKKENKSKGKKAKSVFIFGNREDKIKKLKDYDKNYVDQIIEIF